MSVNHFSQLGILVPMINVCSRSLPLRSVDGTRGDRLEVLYSSRIESSLQFVNLRCAARIVFEKNKASANIFILDDKKGLGFYHFFAIRRFFFLSSELRHHICRTWITFYRTKIKQVPVAPTRKIRSSIDAIIFIEMISVTLLS